MLSIQLGNLISKEERQEEVDKTLVMPISEIFKEFNKYKAIMPDLPSAFFSYFSVTSSTLACTEEIMM